MKEKIYSVIVTNKCNLKCSYCYIDPMKKDSMTEETAKMAAEFIIKNIEDERVEGAQIVFESNEPSLNFDAVKDIISIVSNACGKELNELKFSIFSNLYNISEKKIDWIKENDVFVHTSLDGPKEIHDSNRGVGSWVCAVENIGKLRKKEVGVIASCVVGCGALEKHKEIVDEYIKNGFGGINFRILHELGRAKDNERGYGISEYLEFWKKSLRHILKLNKTLKFIDYKSLFIYNKIAGNKERVNLYSPPCNGINKQIVIDPNGQLFVCDEGRENNFFKIGNIEGGIDTEKIERFSGVLGEVSKNCNCCGIKEYCGPCLAMNDPIIENCKERCITYREQITYVKELIKNEEIKKIFEEWNRV